MQHDLSHMMSQLMHCVKLLVKKKIAGFGQQEGVCDADDYEDDDEDEGSTSSTTQKAQTVVKGTVSKLMSTASGLAGVGLAYMLLSDTFCALFVK